MRLKPFLRITADFLIWARLKENVYPSQSIWQKHGYMDLNDCIANNKKLQPGDKVYANCMGKAIALFLIGKAHRAGHEHIGRTHRFPENRC